MSFRQPVSTEALTEEAIRTSLCHQLVEMNQSDEEGIVLIEELGLCQGVARIDLAVVGDYLHGYEIKSERDSLRRLSLQATVYSKIFDSVTLVCGARHVTQALELVPSWWEVLRIVPSSEQPTFAQVRRGQDNPNRDKRALVELLWLEEAAGLLDQLQALKGLRGKPRADHWDRICELLNMDEVAAAVRTHLKATAVRRGRPARQ